MMINSDPKTPKKKKKRRIHDDFKLTHGRVPVFKPTWFPYSRAYTNENDSSYSSCSSPEEAEVDVDGDEGVDVDVEALDGEDSQNADAEEAAKEEEYTPVKVKRRGGAAGNRDRMAQMIIRRHQGKPSSVVRRQKYKNLANSNSAAPRRAKSDIPSSASPTNYDAGVAGAGLSSSESEEETAPVPLGPSAFWTAMEPYLRPPTDHDLAYITPKQSRLDDPIFTIPALGAHYLQVWANDDGVASPPLRHSARGREGGSGIGFSEVDYSHDDEDAPDPVMGDITQRILQSLIDEHIILNRPPSPFPDETPLPIDENKENVTSSSVPAVPVNTYVRAQMIALEDRIRLELRAIGLLDDEEMDPAEREDDEVCAELRLNQNLLREQIVINNERRNTLIQLVKPKMREHEEARKQKINNLAIEKNYQKLIQKKKKRGGRRAPPPQVAV